MASPEADLWRQAAQVEHDALTAAGTWEPVPITQVPAGHTVLRTLWVFKTKYGMSGVIVRRKARICVDGSNQRIGIDCIQYFAPVVQMTSLRVVAALAAEHGWHLHQLDIDNAFVQAPVDEEVYVAPPQGFQPDDIDGQRTVYRLRRSLYGLRQAPRNFNTALVDYLLQEGFTASATDPCVLVSSDAMLLVYVDDILVTGTTDAAVIRRVLQLISSAFPIKELDPVQWFLGFGIDHDLRAGTVTLHQCPLHRID
jgi:hypothetical protein